MTTDSDLNRTPLYETHNGLGARLIDFGGWEMPVQYTSIMEEHRSVREGAGLFDISHMGEFAVRGRMAAAALNYILTNDVSKLRDWEGQYTQICNERGGVIDDLYVYRYSETSFLLVVNASRTSVDAAWFERQLKAFPAGGEAGVEFKNESEQWAAVALQGPAAAACVDGVAGDASLDPGSGVRRVTELRKNGFAIGKWPGSDAPFMISRTGYTGEDGFEILCAPEAIKRVWGDLLDGGREQGIKPCGLGARDTLRTEVCYPLYGQDLTEATSPLEAGLAWSVALDKENFVGRDALLRQKQGGVDRKLIAFRMTGKSAPPRPGYPIWSVGEDAKMIGEVTSGTQSPSLGLGVGLGYVPTAFAQAETPLDIEIRGRRSAAVVARKPLYRKESNA